MSEQPLDVPFPEGGRLLLTGGGKEFVERIGVAATRRAVLAVLMGENLRAQTEPLTRRRITQLGAALVALFAQGWRQFADFSDRLSSLAVEQITSRAKGDKANVWIAQWLIGLTGKSVQNVLRSDPQSLAAYVADFEAAIDEAAEQSRKSIGEMQMTLGFVEGSSGQRVTLGWKDISRLMTAIGSMTLTIRGSDKSIYGKLFERLVLGSVLSILNFEHVTPAANRKSSGVFWLSDSSDTRESDATLLVRPGKLARFDIGFIGPGNSEISKDKLTRYAREVEIGGHRHNSQTYIIVDRLPDTSKTRQAAEKAGAEIVQMSLCFWPRDLARRLRSDFNYRHDLAEMSDDEISRYLSSRLEEIPIQDFVAGVSASDTLRHSIAETTEEYDSSQSTLF